MNPDLAASGAVDSATGTFVLRNLAAGPHLVAVVAADEGIDLHDPASVRAVARVATPVNLRRGDNRAPVLKVVTVTRQ